MAVFKCKMCGGTVEFEPGATVGVCDSCGTKQTLPRLDDDRRANLYDRANHFRRNNDFDKAAGLYEQILNEDSSDAEAYWSLVLCRYGLESVEDPARRSTATSSSQYSMTTITNPPSATPKSRSGSSTMMRRGRSTKFKRASSPYRRRKSRSTCSSATRRPMRTDAARRTAF